MPTAHVSRSIEIHAPVDRVFEAVNDFNKWVKWSPWLIMEPEVDNSVSEAGKYNEWEGRRSGKGNMRILGEEQNKSIDIKLQFLKPFKSRSKIRFEFESTGESSKATWIMDNKMPFFFFFMKKMMEVYIGMDFERGLRMLKEYCEDGKAHSRIEFTGEEKQEAIHYVAIETECTKETMAKKMQEDFPKLFGYIGENELEMTGVFFTQYLKWNMKRNRIVYRTGAGVKSLPDKVSETIIKGTIPACKVYTLEHFGPYHHLGNAWSTLYTMQRTKDFKINKAIYPFETYHNKPGEVPNYELHTKIHFPIK